MKGGLKWSASAILLEGQILDDVSLQEAKSKNIFHGIKVGDNLVDISHLQFADDALIMGKWSLGNAKNLCRILRCFHMVSGLKVNFTKSKFFSVGVDNDSVLNFASFLKFQPSTLPCTYLGLPMGANMNVERNWRPIVERFQKRLSSWKATTLSYGGRLTLLKSVLGALASNLAMLSKWRWRFHTEISSLWRSLIISIHDNRGGLRPTEFNVSRLSPSPWKSVRSLQNNLSCMNINLHLVFVKKVGNGSSCLFWDDTWFGVQNFKSMFPRLYSLESHKYCKVSDRCIGPLSFNWEWRRHPRNGLELVQYNSLDLISQFSPSSSLDYWECSLDTSKTYQVCYLRKMIDDFLLCSNDDVIRWNNTIPIKVNIHLWHLSNDRLPT
ncbi:hypothetical protein Tco_1233188 [Tanacetum coccineum]